MLTLSSLAASGNSYKEVSNVRFTGMSPDGTMAVGYTKGYADGADQTSFIYNTNTGALEWKTGYNTEDLDKSGQFHAINNSGMIAGAFRDKTRLMQSSASEFAPPRKSNRRRSDDIIYTPVTSAAIWRADGTLINLGIGNYSATDFTDGTDGGYAIAISDDGMRVAGYIQIAWQPSLPCVWTDSGSGYVYSTLKLPTGMSIGYTNGMSADGATIFGTVVRSGQQYPCIWDKDGEPTTITLADYDFDDAHADAISASGRYLLVHGTSYVKPCVFGIYDITDGSLKKITLPEGMISPVGYAVSDNGDVLLGLTSTSTWVSSLHYYSMQTDVLVDFDHYLKSMDLGIDGLPSLTTGTPVGCSSDFSVIVANTSSYSSQPWVLTFEKKEAIILNTPRGKDLFFSAPDKITFRWHALESVPEGATITSYEATIAGKTICMTPDQAVDGVFTATVDATPGTHTASVVAVASTAAGEVRSSASEPRSASLSANTEWRLFDNWDDISLDATGNVVPANDWWNSTLPYGADTEVILWNIESYNFENNTPYYTTTSIATQPWSSALTSRFINATGHDEFYLSYYLSMQMVNSLTQDLSSDYLDVEYSTDGEHWNILKRHNASDFKHAIWNFYQVNLTPELAGRTYQLRFNAHGEGKGNIKWNLDVVNINDVMDGQTPAGVLFFEKDGALELEWTNSIGAYEVSHVFNSNILTDFNIGDEGRPLITAVDLDHDMTDRLAGKYISSLSCFIFDNPAIQTMQPTLADAIVYVDGKETARSTYDRDFNIPYHSTIILDEPVQIEKGRSYRIAVRIYDYDPQQTPVYYQGSTDFIPGVTDLYSSDEGATWHSLADLYDNSDAQSLIGRCIWPLRANITDTAEASGTDLDHELLAYNVLRDGEVINDHAIYSAYPHFTDSNPVAGARYQVQAFYRDGRVSRISDAAANSVNRVESDRPMISLDGETVSASGSVESIEVISIDGTVVLRTSAACLQLDTLADGIYMIRVKTDSRYATRKIALRR